MATQHRIVSRQITQVGDRGASSIHHPPWYVPACCQARAEGGREVHLLRPLAEPAKAGPRGRCIPAIKLVGYQTSHKEIRDLYHDVYLLRRSPGPPCPVGPLLRKEAIQDILSSLRSCLHSKAVPLWCLKRTNEGHAATTPLPVPPMGVPV